MLVPPPDIEHGLAAFDILPLRRTVPQAFIVEAFQKRPGVIFVISQDKLCGQLGNRALIHFSHNLSVFFCYDKRR